MRSDSEAAKEGLPTFKSMRYKRAIPVLVVVVLGFGLGFNVLHGETAEDGVTKLQLESVAKDDMFGSSIAIDGDRAAVGAIGTDLVAADGAATRLLKNAGSVSVFEFDSGAWSELTRLQAPDATPNDGFGFDVSIDGDTVVVGAWHAEAGKLAGAGAAYVFDLSRWPVVDSQRLSSPNPQEKAHFGVSVAIEDGLLVVGAQRENSASDATDAGAAYIYERNKSGAWQLATRLQASTPGESERFGRSVGIADGWIAVGAPGATAGSVVAAGVVNLYNRRRNEWVLAQILNNDVPARKDLFGESLSISGDGLAVASWLSDETAPNGGSVSLFRRDDDTWEFEAGVLPPDLDQNDRFGVDLALSGSNLVVGAHLTDARFKAESGCAWWFFKGVAGWSAAKELVPSELDGGGHFGRAVGLSGRHVLVGAEFDDWPVADSGTVYGFQLSIPSASP